MKLYSISVSPSLHCQLLAIYEIQRSRICKFKCFLALGPMRDPEQVDVGLEVGAAAIRYDLPG
jgi:hypothetical protein